MEIVFALIREFGLAVALVGVGGWWLTSHISDLRSDNKLMQEALFTLTRSSIESIKDLSKIIDELSPSIGALGQANKDNLQVAVRELQTHVDHKMERLKQIMETKCR
jgi:hypothetical protein